MAIEVTHVKRHLDGTIAGVGNQKLGIRASDEVMLDIANGTQYEVAPPHNRVKIRVVQGANGPYLRTEADEWVENNLGQLPTL